MRFPLTGRELELWGLVGRSPFSWSPLPCGLEKSQQRSSWSAVVGEDKQPQDWSWRDLWC